jgi:hypothetical protein
VNILTRWGMSASAATVALALFAVVAHAQQPTPTAPSAKAVPAAAKTEPKKPERRAASVCRGLDETACAARAECTWVAATKTKAGKEVKAHCRIKRKSAGKPPAGEPTKK